jgi:CHAD domain-containing protein
MTKNKNRADLRYTEGLTPKDSLSSLARNILRVEYEALRTHLPRRGASPTPIQIHELRIAARRIRVALRLFARLLPPDGARLREEISWFCRALGEVRDLDVYAEHVAAGRTAAAPAEPTWKLLDRGLAKMRRTARADLVRLLAAERMRSLLVKFEEFVVREPDRGALRRWKSLRIGDAIRGDVHDGVKRMLKLGRTINAESPPEDLHRLRIRAKRLRYELEFYQAFRPSLHNLTRAAKRLQDALGTCRDLHLAEEQLRASAAALKIDAGDQPVIAACEQLEQRVTDLLNTRFPTAWRRFAAAAERTKRGK